MTVTKEEKRGKGGLLLLIGTAAAGIAYAVTRSVEAKEGGIGLEILDEDGNPVPHTGGMPTGGMPVGGGTLNLVPGNYTAKVTVGNTTTINGSPGAAVLTISLLSNISGLLTPVVDAQSFSAGETKVINYPFTVTDALLGKSGTITAAVLAPTGVQLASDFATVVIVTPAIVLGALTATKLYSTSVPAGVAPGTLLDIKSGDSFWADLNFQYQYAGGNYTFLAEINVGGVYLRSYKDVTLPESSTLATINLSTVNQDLFNPGSVGFATTMGVRLSLIYRGSGADYSQWVSVLTRDYAAACRNVTITAPPQVTEFQISIASAAYVLMTDGMQIPYNKLCFFKVLYSGQAIAPILYSCTLSMKKPDGTVLPLTYFGASTGGPSSGPGIYSGSSEFSVVNNTVPFNVSGAYQFTATLKVNGVVAGTAIINAVVPSNIIYGATITIS